MNIKSSFKKKKNIKVRVELVHHWFRTKFKIVGLREVQFIRVDKLKFVSVFFFYMAMVPAFNFRMFFSLALMHHYIQPSLPWKSWGSYFKDRYSNAHPSNIWTYLLRHELQDYFKRMYCVDCQTTLYRTSTTKTLQKIVLFNRKNLEYLNAGMMMWFFRSCRIPGTKSSL